MYDRLEAVSALAPSSRVFLGERPLSRRDLLRVIARLKVAVDSAYHDSLDARGSWARRELAELTRAMIGDRASDTSVFEARWSAEEELWMTRARYDRFNSNGLGLIDAVTHPFGAGRRGLPMGDGLGSSFVATSVVKGGEHVAVLLEPRFAAVSRAERSDGFEFQRAYARAVLRNIAVVVGRDEQHWGQSPISALFLSGNATPAQALTIGTDTPITLPWLLRLAGPARFTMFLADLGASQDPPHAKLAGWQGSFQPWTRLEVGIAVLTQTGGNGGPRGTFVERLVDLFPLIDALGPWHSDIQISNKLAGGNLRVHMPELSNLDFYYEMQIDDFDGRRLKSSFVDDAAHLIGVWLPVVTSHGLVATRVEWHRTSLRLYEHTQFRSGVTYRSSILGDPLGPHAAAGYLALEWRPSPLTGATLTLSDERRDPSLYGVTISGPNDRGFKFVRLTDEPDYRRRRAVLMLEPRWLDGCARFSIGFNSSWRTGESKRTEWLALATIGTRALRSF